jgi:hypothetical protein
MLLDACKRAVDCRASTFLLLLEAKSFADVEGKHLRREKGVHM